MSNDVRLEGNLGKNPEIKTVNDARVANMSLATNVSFKRNNEDVRITDWHNIEAWNKVSERCSNLKKGDRVMVFGSLKYSQVKHEGKTFKIPKVRANKVYKIDNMNQSIPDGNTQDDATADSDNLPF